MPGVNEQEVPRKRRRKAGKPAAVAWLEYALFRAVARLFRGLTPAGLERWSRRVGRLARLLLPRRHRTALRNLRIAFPQLPKAEHERIARACWDHYARTTLEYLHGIDAPFEETARRFDFEGPKDAMFAEFESGNVMVVTAHLGNWEMAGSLAGLVDRELVAVARRLDNVRIDEHLTRGRTRAGIRIIDRRHAARELIRTLDGGGLVAMVADQAVKPREGILAPFLGRPAWTTNAPARLALRFETPIYCIYSIPEGDRFRLVIDPPIRPSELAPEQRTVEWITTAINDRISARIRQYPELWLWMHDRFKGVPVDSSAGSPV